MLHQNFRRRSLPKRTLVSNNPNRASPQIIPLQREFALLQHTELYAGSMRPDHETTPRDARTTASAELLVEQRIYNRDGAHKTVHEEQSEGRPKPPTSVRDFQNKLTDLFIKACTNFISFHFMNYKMKLLIV